MKIKIKYIAYLLSAIVVILLINIIYSQVINMKVPSIFKLSGTVDTWILFNGSIIGAFIGGLIAGLIAYNIAKLKIKEDNKGKSESRKIQYREELRRNILLKLLDINLDMQEGFLYKDTLLKNIIGQIDSYNRALQSGRNDIDLLVRQMQEFFNNNINELEKKIMFSTNNHLEFMRLNKAYEIVLINFKPKLREIMQLLIPNNNRNSMLKHHLFALKDFVNKRESVPMSLKNQLEDVNKNNRKDFNVLEHKLQVINVDIQNAFSDLFDCKINYPEYEEIY